jgi:hypothetical protein
MDIGYQHLVALVQVIMIDVALAGDNALVVGLAASQVARENRARVISLEAVGVPYVGQIDGPSAFQACQFVAQGLGVALVDPFTFSAASRLNIVAVPIRPAIKLSLGCPIRGESESPISQGRASRV